MKVQALLLTLSAVVAGSAHATLKAVEEAWELPLGGAVLPASAGAQLIARRCGGCQPEMLRTTAETQYFVRPGRTAVSLADLRQAAARAAARPSALVYVYYDPRTRAVRRLVLDAGP